MAGACVGGTSLGCAYVYYKDPSFKQKGLTLKMWRCMWNEVGPTELKIETAEIGALYECVQVAVSEGKKSMIVNTSSLLWLSNFDLVVFCIHL